MKHAQYTAPNPKFEKMGLFRHSLVVVVKIFKIEGDHHLRKKNQQQPSVYINTGFCKCIDKIQQPNKEYTLQKTHKKHYNSETDNDFQSATTCHTEEI